MKLDPNFTPYTKINSRQAKDLNVRAKNRRLLEENMGVKLHDLGFGKGLLGMTPKVQTTKEKNRLVFIKIKNIYVLKHTIKKIKRQPQKMRENIFDSHYSQ